MSYLRLGCSSFLRLLSSFFARSFRSFLLHRSFLRLLWLFLCIVFTFRLSCTWRNILVSDMAVGPSLREALLIFRLEIFKAIDLGGLFEFGFNIFENLRGHASPMSPNAVVKKIQSARVRQRAYVETCSQA